MDAQVRELREHLRGRDVENSTLRQHLALLTSDFKYNLKLLEDRDTELDQCEAQLALSEKSRTLKIKEMDVLAAEVANLKSTSERDAVQIQELESTLGQYKESVRSVRERLEEALQLRDQELACHRSELEALRTKLHEQTESLKVQEKGVCDAVKACERTWSQRYSECHKTVMNLVAEQDSLLKEKREKEKDMERMQEQVLDLQKQVHELAHVANSRKKECAAIKEQLVNVQEQASSRLGELDQEKQKLEENLRKKILEEYDGKIAELLAQLQSIEYAVSLERREAHTRFIALETQHAEQVSTLHQRVQVLRRERDALLENVAKLEKEMAMLKGSLLEMRSQEKRLSARDASLTEEVRALQESLHEAQTLLEKSEVDKTHEISLLHDFLREAKAKEHMLSKKEAELVKHINTMEKSLGEAKSNVEKLSKRESGQRGELIEWHEALTEARSQKDVLFKKNVEHVKEIATLNKSLLEARNQADMFSKKHAEFLESSANLQQSLIEERNQGEMMSRKNEEYLKDVADLKHILHAAKIQEDLMRRKLEDQATEILNLQESFCTVKVERELLLKAEAANADEICMLRRSIAESQSQADALQTHAKHPDARLQVTRADTKWKIGVQKNVSRMITEAQDLRELGITQDRTPVQYSPSARDSEALHALCDVGMDDGRPAIPSKATQELDHGLKDDNRDGDHKALGCGTGSFVQDLKQAEGPQNLLEKENRFLKARVEELHGENLKVGRVISDLRQELEAVGLLRGAEGLAVSLTGGDPKCLRELNCNADLSPSRENMPLKVDSQLDVDPILAQEAISLAEKEELEMLQKMMKDLHNKNVRFYTQVESMRISPEKLHQKPLGEYNDISPPHAMSATDFHGTSRTQQEPNIIVTSCPTLSITDDAGSGLQKGQSPNTNALTVSAEVLKLNEQIARVRQQLTSLCSTDHTTGQLLSPRIMGKHQLQSKSPIFDIPPKPHKSSSHVENQVLRAAKLGESDHNRSRCGRFKLPHYHDFCKGDVPCRSSREQDAMPTRHKANQNSAFSENMLAGKSSLHTDLAILKEEVQPSPKHPRLRRETPSTRPLARDSLGTAKKRPTVNKKVKVRVPSIASSHSDVVCSHCQRYITEEELEETLQNSTPEVSCNPQGLDNDHPQSKHAQKYYKQWDNCASVRIDDSTGSENREVDQSLHQTQQKLTNVVLPALQWSDDTDESHPAGKALQHKIVAKSSSHSTQMPLQKAPSKTRERRGAQGGPAKGVKDDTLMPKLSGMVLRKKGGLSAGTKGVRKEKTFPANLRESLHSLPYEVGQFRISASQPSRVL